MGGDRSGEQEAQAQEEEEEAPRGPSGGGPVRALLPPPPTKYKHTLGWDDSAGDGLVREIYEWVDPPPTDSPPPRPLPKPQDPPAPKAAQSFGVYSGTFGRVQAKRLLDRAGFGPKPGQALELAQLGLQGAVRSLTRPSGTANLSGPAPVDGDGLPIAPTDSWGHDHLWWLDRMLRSDQQLVERMALVFHDWFATSNDKVDSSQLMIDQSNMFRANCFGSFRTLLENVTQDPAMLIFLDGVQNTKSNPNENYGREVQELFTLGADRGAYTETDVRELARCFTGFDYDWSAELGRTTSATSRPATTTPTRPSTGRPATGPGRTAAGSASRTRCTPPSSC